MLSFKKEKKSKLFVSLRNKYQEFIYQDFCYKKADNALKISFKFLIDPDINFTPQIIIKNINASKFNFLDKKILDNFIFHLGLIETLSYWKLTCSPRIKINAGSLNKEQLDWWQDLLIKGMGQFFYTNRIDFKRENFIKIISKKTELLPVYREKLSQDRMLIPVGGGKDSAVGLEILKRLNFNRVAFFVNPTKAMSQVANLAGIKNEIVIERIIDKKLLALNKQGYLNGHTPFSAFLAFMAVFCALVFDCGIVTVGQERSSNEGNVNYLGKMINHQYSKSYEFENNFRSYLNQFLTTSVNYFSFLRPLYEIQISKIFSQHPRYWPVFKSCNLGQKNNIWCGTCSKCLFIFTTLYPFIAQENLIKIFKKNLFQEKSYLPVFKQMLGINDEKPFECIGTQEETMAAFYLSLKKAESREKKIPFLLEVFRKEILPKQKMMEIRTAQMLKSWDENHNLDKKFVKILKNAIN